MSDGNQWKSVTGHTESNNDYKGYGRETLITASKQIQSRSKMSQSQIEIVCNCMVELSFTENLTTDEKKKKMKMVIDSEKISSLNMNLDASQKKKINGFSPLFRNQNTSNSGKRSRPSFNIALPTLNQTSNTLMLPRLDM